MDDVVIITEILKYFNFQELCIAERINPNFKSCVEWELYWLKYVDFDQIFTGSWIKVLNKIEACCSGLHHLKNFSRVTSFVVVKRCLDSPDPFTEEEFKENFFILLRSLEKLTCLEIDWNFIKIFGWESALTFVGNSHNLKQLGAPIRAGEIFDNELTERINKVIIGHSALTKLEIYGDFWIDLSLCRNLTDFKVTLYNGTMNFSKYEQLFALLDVNLNLERLDIARVSHNNLQLIEKLMRLPKLKSLSLDIRRFNYTQLDEDLLYHRVMKDSYFVSLQNIEVYCKGSESHAKFVAFLLSRSPLLKEFFLRAYPPNLASYRIIFDKFPLYDRIEIFKLDISLAADEVQSFICNEISKMVNLKHFWINYNGSCSDDIEKISELRKLKFLSWSANHAAALKMMRSISSLKGIDLYVNNSASPGSFDLILDQCPTLRYFSVDFLNAEQIRELPLKAPNLQYILIRKYSYSDLSPIEDALTYAVENFPHLRQLLIPQVLYDLLVRLEPIKRLSRQKKLSIISDWHPYDLINEWIHLCCQENPST